MYLHNTSIISTNPRCNLIVCEVGNLSTHVDEIEPECVSITY